MILSLRYLQPIRYVQIHADFLLPMLWGLQTTLIHSQTSSFPQTEVKKHIMKAALARGVETGVLIQVKASYKLSADAKKQMGKKSTAKSGEAKKKTVSLIVSLASLLIHYY